MTRPRTILHATTVAIDGRGVLITGASGSGKSALAIELLARGATLVSDDRTEVARDGPRIIASVPDAIEGLIEARFVGLIRVAPAGPTALRLVVDMDQVETDRLPQPHTQDVLDVALPCLHKGETPHFPSSVLLYVKALI